MNLTKTITNLHLSPKGGVYRTLPLFSESCVAEGYGNLIKRISGVTYGPCGAIGDTKGWHTFYDIDGVVEKISKKIHKDKAWILHTKTHADHACRKFQKELNMHSSFVQTDPRHFLRFIIQKYPRYMAGIGAFNLFWRYLEFAQTDMTRFPRKGLWALSVRRNKFAEIYPHCEKLIVQATHELSTKLDISSKLLLMMNRQELSKTLNMTRLAVPKSTLKKRASGYVYLYMNGKEYIETSSHKLAALRNYLRSKQVPINSGSLHGTPVSPGRITGTVITKIKRTSWPRNPILITPMTHPSDLPYLKKIKGLITDEGGGILSHAAIVSRELKIPCVISTRIATRILRDGDRVEVDATHGTVRKLT